jgi:hypothetical protein
MKRYDLCWEVKEGNKFITLDRSPWNFQKFEDTTIHICKGGEMIWEIAAQYYKDIFERPSMWYWIIADFQPSPILDATLAMQQGQKVYIPSERVIRLFILDPDRNPEFENW